MICNLRSLRRFQLHDAFVLFHSDWLIRYIGTFILLHIDTPEISDVFLNWWLLRRHCWRLLVWRIACY